jgi:hypothetical protein
MSQRDKFKLQGGAAANRQQEQRKEQRNESGNLPIRYGDFREISKIS